MAIIRHFDTRRRIRTVGFMFSFHWNVHQKIAGAVFGLSAAAVLGFMSMTPPAFSEARYSLGIAAISLFALYILWVVSSETEARAQLFYGLAVALILVFGVVYGTRWIDYRQTTYPNTPLYSGILAGPKLIENGRIANNVLLQIGRARVFFDNTNTLDLLLKRWGDDRLTVETIYGRAYISTRVRDEHGNIIAELIKNEWKINPPPATWDRNYRNDALEVIDTRGDVKLQIRILPGIVQIQGEWWLTMNKNLRQRLVWAEAPDGGGAVLSFCDPEQACTKIRKMFKYPSDKHLGELD
jgi:hypothetical protein